MTDLSSLIADQWQPMGTAPRNGQVVDLWNATVQERAANAKFKDGKWKVWWLTGFGGMGWVNAEYQNGFTHWMPLSSPPRAKEDASNG